MEENPCLVRNWVSRSVERGGAEQTSEPSTLDLDGLLGLLS
jgi:hypothetical protein